MDINETLAQMRTLAHAAFQDSANSVDHAQLAELFEALDDWLAYGGFLPDAWEGTKRTVIQPQRTIEPEDTVVREAGVTAVTRITEKVEQRAHEALYGTTAEDENELHTQRLNALKYAASALRGINTALSLGRGGYVGQDDTTGLFFHGVLTGAVIDRDNEFTAHT